jgi:hypothetical protein
VIVPSPWSQILDFFGTPLVIEPSPGQLSGDAGLLPIRQFDQRVGLTRAFAAALDDPRDPDLTEHSFLEMVRSRVYGILAGYEDQNDHDTLRHDPVFKLVADRSPSENDLASQPTLSRFENAISIKSLKRLRDAFLDQFVASFESPPRHLTFDLDAVDDPAHLTDRLEEEEEEHWRAFRDGIKRLTGYLAAHHPDQYTAILDDFATPPEEGGPGPDDFVDACVKCYRAHFDPATVAAEVGRLEAEHTALMERWADLPTPGAKEKAKGRFAELEARIAELRRQQEDAAEVVAEHYREMLELQTAIADARLAMRSQGGERALRQRAEALRAVIQRIECAFTATGQTGGGWGKKNSRLATVTIYPVAGDAAEFSADSNGTLMYSSAHSRMNRTRVGRIRYRMNSGLSRPPRYCRSSGLPSQTSCRTPRWVTTSATPVIRTWSWRSSR